VGRRGNNAFAARAPRLPRHNSVAPGPGTYEAAVPAHRTAAPLSSAPFVLPGSVNPLKIHARPSPGPGEYADGSSARSARGPTHARSAFIPQAGASKEGRLEVLDGDKCGPGPGQYDTASPRASSLPPKGWTIGASMRRLVQDDSAAAEPPLPSLLKKGADMIADTTRRPSPGPGDYDLQQPSEGARHLSNRGLSSFQAGLSHLPRQWRPPSPGPGAYGAAVNAEPTAVAAAHASFASALPRFQAKAPPAPGPAYYSPRRKGTAQSFHLNLQGKWV